MASVVVVWLTVVTAYRLITAFKYPADCKIKQKKSIPYSLFSLNGEPLETVGKGMIFSPQNDSSECTVPLKKVIDILDFPDFPVIGLFHFICKNRIKIYINDENTTQLHHVASYFQLEACIIDVGNLNKVGSVSDLRVLTFYHSVIQPCTIQNLNQTISECTGLNKAVTLYIAVGPNSDKLPDLLGVLDCEQKFPIMAEVVFTNMSWGVLPDYVREKFPNLQALELPYNSLTEPPDFPWTDYTVALPANLSRTPYFQDHYSKSFHLDIEAHIFRRTLVLDNNNITDLRNYTFNGFLHYLSVKSNRLKWIGPDTLSSVRGLQTLELSYNELSEISGTFFRQLVSLKHLDLRHNSLTSIKPNTFKRLFHLQYLNLGHNLLTTLQDGMFSDLHNLQELHLEFNSITRVSREFIAGDNIELNLVYLNNNPITVLPDVFLLLRKLEMVDLSWTNISFENFTAFLENIPGKRLKRSVVSSASKSVIDYDRSPDKLREINLANSRISLLYLENNLSEKQATKLKLLLKNFKLNLNNNPLDCDCNIINFNTYIRRWLANGTFKGEEYFFKSWRCSKPEEFRGRPMLTVKADETYCKENVTFCPPACQCSRRHGSGIIIVDCRDRGLSSLPKRLPSGILDLWFQKNNISKINDRDFWRRVRHLYVSNNQLTQIADGVLPVMDSLEDLRLDGNRLTRVNKEVIHLHQTFINIEHNPFRCDCETLWMKKWMIENKFFIRNWSEIICNTGNDEGEGKQFVLVPNEEFVCQEDFDTIRHVVTPSVSSSLCIILVIIIMASVYCFRIDLKVLLYVYFGIHPFDKDSGDQNEEVDAVIIHSADLTDWVVQNVVSTLENCEKRLTVYDMSRDFIAGFSFQENISSLLCHSRRLVLCVSQSMQPDNEIFQISWNAAREKIKESKTNFAVIVSYDIPMNNLKEKEIRKYIRPGRYINKKEKLFKEKLLYSMPCDKRQNSGRVVHRPTTTRSFVQSIHGDIPLTESVYDVFISYADRDIPFLLRFLQPELEKRGYRLCIQDRDFMPGAAKEENILGAIEKSKWTLFILSGAHLQDEWSLFTFRAARGKSLREKSNHLVVTVVDGSKTDNMDEEIGHYLQTHVCIQADDKWFWQRFSMAMPLNVIDNDNKNREDSGDMKNGFIALNDIHINPGYEHSE